MDVREVGMYLRRQAQLNGLTIEAATAAAGVRPNYIWRLETGQIKRPSVQKLKALTEAVKGTWEEVGRLLDSGGNGRNHQKLRHEIEVLFDQLTDEETDQVLDEIRARRTRRQCGDVS